MCGLAGFIQLPHGGAEAAGTIARRMADRLAHRGPDDSGVWTDSSVEIALSHRRLSILDLSPHGHQPMLSPSGRFVIVLNGEIYNFKTIRGLLEREHGFRAWRGHSDTEVLLAAIEHWGVQKAVERAVGMFAFAVWDRLDRMLYLARDRLGEKPLYYGWEGNVFLFASELKAVSAHPAWKGEIDRDSLALFLRHGYVPGPRTIYKGLFKLPPGSILAISDRSALETRRVVPAKYWSASGVAKMGLQEPFEGTEPDAVERLDELLRNAIRDQMIADVPVGAFLSGGIDSSTVVALMQRESAQPVKTFTIGFYEEGYNEADHARAVARHLHTDHTELYVTASEAQAVIPSLPAVYDEPFADASQIPTLLICRLARGSVTVSLSGDGGDELFGGYNRYLWGRAIWRKIGWMPASLRTVCRGMLKGVAPRHWDMLSKPLMALLPRSKRYSNVGDKLHKLADIVDAANPDELFFRLVSHWTNPTGLVLGSAEQKTAITDRSGWPETDDFVLRMMFTDLVSYLPDDILVKVDRAAMAVSLETRVPFLDHRVVEFASALPMYCKIRGGVGKWVLRQVLYRYVPREIVERPKSGFGIPLESWLRGPLREWAENLLDESRLRQQSFFSPMPIRKRWNEHMSGGRNWQYSLWPVLMFQAWLENQKTPASAKHAA
ncbi:MAG: asparagine synthase (glutamine-hydrolyzing) [Sulfurifustaceae bacterium]